MTGKLLVRIKPKFNQEIKNQNLANLLVRINLTGTNRHFYSS